MTTMRQGIGGAPRLRCSCWPRGGQRRRRATSCCSTVALSCSCSRAIRTGGSTSVLGRGVRGAGCRRPGSTYCGAPRGAPRAPPHYEGTTPVRRRAARLSHCVLVLPGHPHRAAHGRRVPAMGRVSIDRPERREGNGAPRVPVATQERERPSVADETCCSTAALRVRAPGHQHRAADGRRVPAMGRVSQSTGPSGEKGNGAPRIPVAEAEEEHCRRDVLLDCRSSRSCSRAPAQGGRWSAGPRPWGVSHNRPARAARKVMARHVYRSLLKRESDRVADVTCCSTGALRVRAPGHQHRAANGRRVPAMGVCRSIGPSGEARYWRTDVLSWETGATRHAPRPGHGVTTPPPLTGVTPMFSNVIDSDAGI